MNISFTKQLEEIRAAHGIPALAAASYVAGRTAVATTGFREIGKTDRVSLDDLWHIGSCTKSMTATLAARLIEGGLLQWTDKLCDIIACRQPKDNTDSLEVHDAWRDVTLEQLLSHTAGAPHAPPEELWQIAWQMLGSPRQQRASFVQALLQRPPEISPGSSYLYSNQGYSMAGMMLEECSDSGWEDLMQKWLFQPLKMNSCGFGAPGSATCIDQPRGHEGLHSSMSAMQPGPLADNPAAIGPGGIVHCSMQDLIHYAAVHADHDCPHRSILSPQSWQKLHEPYPDALSEYAMGWNVVQRQWAGGKTLMHAGSNTMWFTVIWIAPMKKAAFIAATNCAGPAAEAACDQVSAALVTGEL